MAEKPSLSILDFSGATGLQKGQGRGARLKKFETRPTSRSGPVGEKGGGFGGPPRVRHSRPHGTS
jgi:hypothetical protein